MLIMYSASWRRILGVGVLWVRWANGAATALSISPSNSWYGVDGSWSALTVGVGPASSRQWMDVMASTVSSETWVVGAGGCLLRDLTCIASRGKIFFPNISPTWNFVGRFNLGADQDLGNFGYADYGLDSLTLGTTGKTIPSSIIGAFNGTDTINTTYYMTGSFGLGIVDGTFNGLQPLSALNALVKTEAAIQSHSYGFTAGASYQQKGEPVSLTLGGYDSARFTPHDVTFGLNPSKQPQTFLESVNLTSGLSSSNFSNSNPLLSTNDRVNAIIDSSTPYLWLPQAACERFAAALGLVYDTSLNLYTFGGNDSQHDLLAKSQLSFSFSLTDMASSTATVNITVPYAAFDLKLTWPAIPNTTYGAANATRNYFPLRQANNSAQYRIGRAFLQEAYIVTNYENNKFAVFQAVHPSDPVGSAKIVAIAHDATSIIPAPPSKSSSSLPTGAIVGIVVGVIVLLTLIIVAVVFFLRRRKPEQKDSDSLEKPIATKPRTILDRIRRRPAEPLVHETTGSTSYPTEVGADATHERFELPAPLGPAELDSDSGTWDGTTEHGDGTADSSNLSAYERARRKLEAQQAAAMALHSFSAPHEPSYPAEKNEHDISPVAHYRPSDRDRDIESPLVSPVCADSPHSLTIDDQSVPSPVSPGFAPSPTTPTGPPSGPPPMYRRINPANVVYAGRLPDNVQLPAIVPKLVGSDGRTVRTATTIDSDVAVGTNSSLGSQYTEAENERGNAGTDDLYGSGDTNIVSPLAPGSTASGSGNGDTNLVSPIASNSTASGDSRGFHMRGGSEIETDRTLSGRRWPSRRRLGALGEGEEDFVHVPQPAENRFSWEEDKISGREEEGNSGSL